MKLSLMVPILVLLVAPCCFAQNANDSLVSILDSRWQRARQPAKKADNAATGPARMLTQDDKNFRRSAREQQTKGALDPHEYSIDNRSAALEKSVQEARSPKSEDVNGYAYFASVKNDGNRTIDVVFWEYRFTELANPANLVRRQFLCAGNIKAGQKKELSAFSLLGPSDVISAESLANNTGKLFDEKVLVNRVEYSDGAVLQRRDWKYDEVSKAVERATSTPWGKEVCRGI